VRALNFSETHGSMMDTHNNAVKRVVGPGAAPTVGTTEPEFIGAEQGSVILNVSISTFRRLAMLPDFPRCMEFGRLRKWHRAALMSWAGGMGATAERGGRVVQVRG
jgi:hypothetical protein